MKWETSADDIQDPTFSNIYIASTKAGTTETSSVQFVGTFSAISYTQDTPDVLLFGAGNTLNTPKSGDNLGAFRAYFKLNGLTAADIASTQLNFDGEATSINEVLRINAEESADTWYDLQGRKLRGKPTQKGIYIYHGIKRVIK